MNTPKLRTVGLLLLTLVGAGSIALGFRGRSHERYAEQQAQYERDRATWIRNGGSRAAIDVTSDNFPKLLPRWRSAQEEVRGARMAIAMGFETVVGVPTLSKVLDTAAELERAGSLLGQILAASLVNQVLDAVDGKPAAKITAARSASDNQGPPQNMPENTAPLSSTSVRRLLIGHSGLLRSKHPLEGERLWRLSAINSMRDSTKRMPMVFRSSFVSAATADAMEQYTGAIREMERNLLADDEQQCRKNAAGLQQNILLRSGVGEILCPKMMEVVRAGRRLESVRKRYA